MKKCLFFCLVMLFSFGFSTHTLFAQNKRPISQDVMNKLDSLSPEQWKQFQKKKAKFDSLSPAQKKMIRARLKNRYDSLSVNRTKLSKKNMKASYDSLSPQQKEKFKEDILKGADSIYTRPKRKALTLGNN